MLNRRKVLLSLIESFGGVLKPTDCQKLMFLLRQDFHLHYYDFFPYKYGAFSLVLADDKRHLINLGYLERGESFKICGPRRFICKIHPSISMAILSLVKQVGPTRGNELLRVVYKRFPYYATRSEKAADILSPAEYAKVRKQNEQEITRCLFTLGYEGKSVDLYLDTLKNRNIKVLIDVRNNPLSRKYGFSKINLKRFVSFIGTEYVHLPELGIPSKMRTNLDSDIAYSNLFEHYEERILPNQTESLGRIKGILHRKKRVALTCFESDHSSCHRSKITEYLASNNAFATPIEHL